MSIISKRHSIRLFNKNKIHKEILLELVYAGMIAPSSKNKRPWKFLIIDDKEKISKISTFHNNWRLLDKVKYLIIVCGDLEKDEREKHLVMTSSAASQNILLRATELNLGSLWLGCYPDKERMEFIRNLTGAGKNILPISVIAIGHSDKKDFRERLFDESLCVFNKF